MLRSLTEGFPGSWNTALLWVLFAYREVPVETLGCSPFDRPFGRSVAGHLSLLKSAWLQETDLQGAKQNVVQFIRGTRERLLMRPMNMPRRNGLRRRNGTTAVLVDHL